MALAVPEVGDDRAAIDGVRHGDVDRVIVEGDRPQHLALGPDRGQQVVEFHADKGLHAVGPDRRGLDHHGLETLQHRAGRIRPPRRCSFR
jgi:hypothetical protein